MDKTTLHFFTEIKNGEVKHIGKKHYQTAGSKVWRWIDKMV